MFEVEFPPFEPHRLLPGGHAQTLYAVYFPGRRYPYRAVPHRVTLGDGDAIVLHDDRPPAWRPGRRAVLLVHGLEGDHRSSYMQRIAGKLHERGIRSFRMDLRGCGAGRLLSRRPYHAGCSRDAVAALERMADLCPESPLSLAGFSMGGNIILKALGEFADVVPGVVDSAVAVNPCIDLDACNRWLNRRGASFYDRHFAALLRRRARHLQEIGREILPSLPPRRPRSLREFDDWFTAPACGFRSVEDYYQRASAAPFIGQIRVPTCILTAGDDPMIPAQMFERLPANPAVRIHITRRGGHLGFIGRGGVDPDRRWMDWRILDWIAAADRARNSRPTPAPALAPLGANGE